MLLRESTKPHSRRILTIFNSKIQEYGINSVIIASDFDKYIRNFSKKIITDNLIVDDKAISVQVADALVYSYRRTRNRAFIGKVKISLLK